MKSLVCALLILAIVVVSGIFYTKAVTDISDELISINNKISVAVGENDFKTANIFCEKLDKVLKEKRMLLTSNIDHTVIDNIEQNLIRVKSLVEMKEKNEALTYIKILELQLSHLPRSFNLKAENVL